MSLNIHAPSGTIYSIFTAKEAQTTVGIIDVGGGMRDVYSAGVYDRLLDENVSFEYYLGVSAGSANLISYLGGQRGRNVRFYTEYARRREYMSISNLVKKGSYIDLDYIYSVLSGADGENPVDYDAVLKSKSRYVAVATRADDGKPQYFTNSDLGYNNIDIIKASCCLPVVCRPYEIGGVKYFDGGVSDPLPLKKALDDGCDSVVVVLTRPSDFVKKPQRLGTFISLCLRDYPQTAASILRCHDSYNKSMELLHEYEKAGKAVIVAPSDCCGVNTLTRDKQRMESLYDKGYEDALKAVEFVKSKLQK